MTTKYFGAIIAIMLTSLTAFGSDTLSVIFPDSTNQVFSVPISGKTGERPYDAFLEHPTEYDGSTPTKFERTGLGYYISIEVIEESDIGVRCKLKIDHHSLSDFTPYNIGEAILLQPKFTSLSTDTELTLPVGKWFTMGEDVESHRIQLLFERKESQQGGPGYPPQGVGSPDP